LRIGVRVDPFWQIECSKPDAVDSKKAMRT